MTTNPSDALARKVEECIESAAKRYYPTDFPAAVQRTVAHDILALVRAEVEACCIAVCEHCRAGHKPKASKDYGAATPFVHLFQGFPPRECKAAAIRSRRGE